MRSVYEGARGKCRAYFTRVQWILKRIWFVPLYMCDIRFVNFQRKKLGCSKKPNTWCIPRVMECSVGNTRWWMRTPSSVCRLWIMYSIHVYLKWCWCQVVDRSGSTVGFSVFVRFLPLLLFSWTPPSSSCVKCYARQVLISVSGVIVRGDILLCREVCDALVGCTLLRAGFCAQRTLPPSSSLRTPCARRSCARWCRPPSSSSSSSVCRHFLHCRLSAIILLIYVIIP